MTASPILAAISGGDRLDTLKALRDRLAEDIDSPATPPRDRAALSRQLVAVLDLIEKEAPVKEDSPLDRILKSRAKEGKPTAPRKAGARSNVV